VSNSDYAVFTSTNGLSDSSTSFVAGFDQDAAKTIDNSDYAVFTTDNGVRFRGLDRR